MNNPIALDDATDEHFMRRALELAKKGEGAVEPNPMVGCVIARDGSVLGEGYHRRFGGDHAEVEAIRSSGTSRLENATAYVSLEPCCHHGKTPPCSEALIQAGVGRVVIAMEDPFPKVAGGGVNHLKNAGLEVTTNVLRDHAVKLNSPYLKRVSRQLPPLQHSAFLPPVQHSAPARRAAPPPSCHERKLFQKASSPRGLSWPT